ncbi:MULTISPECIES: PadR family transcriptional regulator [Streptomyces]|jgi:DNA-binding PadR family transcriptional regulator|uniref:PadR family transcriptional regulator n=1 Tax=Streptomyces TaxID=1883 RepID=UPI0006BAB438|nr:MULTISPECIES: PadR family transcriptional regulator [Streptomyces]KPH96933.1 transcriptional regulator, PadR-like family [Actinobacteria bacterium OK006]MCX4422455.1 PadR family transcriptional regulator [Streptomyces mirabilis]MCX4610768.1 PadR family transcriptional regulator [Streptomyces mirabilis]MCX5350984.1 PadR family transcriptional regulator [Streptomyces mirabilis]NMI59976.1 PadR family transcriptional regulator [Streptomyces sp. RLA2-12]
MSAIRLLVLGAVRQHGRAHGYQVRNDLEYWGAHEWSNAKPGSIYHALKQMAKQGLLLAHEIAPSTAGGPPRTEYEITDQGTEEYFTLLRRSLTAYDQKPDILSAALGFMVDLGRAETLELLRERVRAIEEWRKSVTGYYTPEDGPGQLGHIGEIMNFWVHSADSGAQWTRGLIERIQGGAYTFAGEGEPFVGVLVDGEENPYATRTPHPGDQE